MEAIDLNGGTAFLMDFPAEGAFDALRRETPWSQRQMLMFGRYVAQPRLTAWYGDPGCSYSYSGIRNEPLPWTPLLSDLRVRIETLLEVPFNSVLLNFYRSGRDSISMHSDNERELGPEPIIASVSLGVERKFVFRHRAAKEGDVVVPLRDQSLMVMMGETQKNWLHGVDKVKDEGERINLTFRRILVD